MKNVSFRAWANGKMHTGQHWYFGTSGFWSLDDQESKSTCNSLESENPVLMQNTGLSDDNGSDIFEGDVVKGIATSNDNTSHEFIGVVKWDSEDTGFYYGANGNWPCIKPWFVKEVEILGNIFENKELSKNG